MVLLEFVQLRVPCVEGCLCVVVVLLGCWGGGGVAVRSPGGLPHLSARSSGVAPEDLGLSVDKFGDDVNAGLDDDYADGGNRGMDYEDEGWRAGAGAGTADGGPLDESALELATSLYKGDDGAAPGTKQASKRKRK
jgi:hypothetical protein